VGWVGAVKVSVMQVRLRFLASMHHLTPPVQLAFNPLNSHILYVPFRRRDEIHSWDLRSSTVIPLETFRYGNGSRLEKNQRMTFDIGLGGKLMGVGDQVSIKRVSRAQTFIFGIERQRQYVYPD